MMLWLRIKMAKNLLDEANKNSKTSGVIVEKFLVMLTRYPGGKVYPKIIPLGKDIKANNKNVKRTEKKEASKIELQGVEKY